jgi:uncharacterized protein YcbX
VVSLTSLFVYPIKSCKGIALERGLLTPAGLAHDREWMVISSEGRFLTQRELPRMALITPAFTGDALQVEAAGAPALSIPLAPPEGPAREVKVWGDPCRGIDAGDEAARWFSDFLGRSVRLLRFDASSRRTTDPEWSAGVDGETRFSDGFPLLVLSRASFDDLNARLPQPLPLDRFRPNLFIDGCEPYGEDSIRSLTHGAIRIRLTKPCTRCVITTTDQVTGTPVGDEPLRTLKTYRWDAKLRGVAFAMNAIVEKGAGAQLEVGMQFDAQR